MRCASSNRRRRVREGLMASLRKLHARYRGRCRTCRNPVAPGDVIYYDTLARRIYCEACGKPLFEAPPQSSQLTSPASVPPQRPAISKQKVACWSVALTGASFCMGLSSDRLWPVMFTASVAVGAWCFLAKRAADARMLLIASITLFALASGSITRDCLDGGLFDHAPTALCGDGTYSFSQHPRGTCSWHHGVAVWNPAVPWWRRM